MNKIQYITIDDLGYTVIEPEIKQIILPINVGHTVSD